MIYYKIGNVLYVPTPYGLKKSANLLKSDDDIVKKHLEHIPKILGDHSYIDHIEGTELNRKAKLDYFQQNGYKNPAMIEASLGIWSRHAYKQVRDFQLNKQKFNDPHTSNTLQSLNHYVGNTNPYLLKSSNKELLFRGVAFSSPEEQEKFVDSLHKHGGFTSGAYASWTTNPKSPATFIHKSGLVYLQRNNISGRSIAPFSTFVFEREVLMPPTSHHLGTLTTVRELPNSLRSQLNKNGNIDHVPVAIVHENPNKKFNLVKSSDDDIVRKHLEHIPKILGDHGHIENLGGINLKHKALLSYLHQNGYEKPNLVQSALSDWSDVAYEPVRELQLNQTQSDSYASDVLNHLNHYISKTNPYPLKPSNKEFMFRGVSFHSPDEQKKFLDSLHKHGGFTSGAYSSWTTNPELSTDEMFIDRHEQSFNAGLIYLQKNNVSGRSIAPFSNLLDEKEVLVPPTSHQLSKLTTVGKLPDFVKSQFYNTMNSGFQNIDHVPVALVQEKPNKKFNLVKSNEKSSLQKNMKEKSQPKKQQKRDRASRFVTQPHEIKYCPKTGRILNG